MTNPQRGWYPDPANSQQERFWSGEKWEENTRPATKHSQQSPKPTSAAQDAPQPEKTQQGNREVSTDGWTTIDDSAITTPPERPAPQDGTAASSTSEEDINIPNWMRTGKRPRPEIVSPEQQHEEISNTDTYTQDEPPREQKKFKMPNLSAVKKPDIGRASASLSRFKLPHKVSGVLITVCLAVIVVFAGASSRTTPVQPLIELPASFAAAYSLPLTEEAKDCIGSSLSAEGVQEASWGTAPQEVKELTWKEFSNCASDELKQSIVLDDTGIAFEEYIRSCVTNETLRGISISSLVPHHNVSVEPWQQDDFIDALAAAFDSRKCDISKNRTRIGTFLTGNVTSDQAACMNRASKAFTTEEFLRKWYESDRSSEIFLQNVTPECIE